MNDSTSLVKPVVVVVAAFLGAMLFMVRPAYVDRADVARQIETLKQRAAGGEHDRALLLSAQERLETLQRRLAAETRDIPDSGDVAGMIRGISRDIRDLELRDELLRRGTEVVSGRAASIGLQVETTGSFDVVVELLRRLESLPRLVRIGFLEVKHKDSALGEVRATVGLDAYYRVAASGP